jgi:hypothetical protein
MEKDVQHAVVASIEITEPGERPGLPLVRELVTDVDAGCAVRLTVGAGETARAVAAWLAGMDIAL